MSAVETDDMRKTMRNVLYDWAKRILADEDCVCPIVWDNTGGVREKPPFIAFQLLASVRNGFPYMSGVDEDTGEQTARHDMKMTVSIHGFGQGAMERLEVLRDGIHWSEYMALLRKAGLVVNAITDLSLSSPCGNTSYSTQSILPIAPMETTLASICRFYTLLRT